MNLGEQLKRSIEDRKISELAKTDPLVSALFVELTQKKIEIAEMINDGFIVEKIGLETVIPEFKKPDPLIHVMVWFSNWCNSEGLNVDFTNSELFGYESSSLIIWPRVTSNTN